MDYKRQYHFTQNIDLGTSQNSTVYVPACVSFPVKKIKFNFAYYISANIPTLYLVTSTRVNNEVVGSLGKYIYTDGAGVDHMADQLSEQNVIYHVFDQPQQFNGTIPLTFQQIIPGVVINSANIVSHIEFLG